MSFSSYWNTLRNVYEEYTMKPAEEWTTPLGFPVEPEVYNINSISSESKISGSHWDETSHMQSCHQKSLPDVILIFCFVLSNTITLSIVLHFSRASSTTGLTGIVLFPLKFPSEVKTIFAWQSFILSASEVDEKPAKTTEWTAPTLAQANIAIAASGTIGIYIITLSPFLIPFSLRAFENLQVSW